MTVTLTISTNLLHSSGPNLSLELQSLNGSDIVDPNCTKIDHF